MTKKRGRPKKVEDNKEVSYTLIDVDIEARQVFGFSSEIIEGERLITVEVGAQIFGHNSKIGSFVISENNVSTFVNALVKYVNTVKEKAKEAADAQAKEQESQVSAEDA